LERLSVDMAAFFNIYKHLVTREPGGPFPEADPPPFHMVLPFTFDNKLHGETYGAEAAAKLRVTEAWRLIAGYSWLKMDLSLDGSSNDDSSLPRLEGSSPRHQFNVRSHLDLSRVVEFDAALYYVDDLPAQGVPDYTRVDARLGWRPRDGLELSLAIQNIFDKRHPEFASIISGLSSGKAPRSVYGKATWEF
jgi:iron complex outermembrane receptor protein